MMPKLLLLQYAPRERRRHVRARDVQRTVERLLLHRAQKRRGQKVCLPLCRRRRQRRRGRRSRGPKYRILSAQDRHRAEVRSRRQIIPCRRRPPQLRHPVLRDFVVAPGRSQVRLLVDVVIGLRLLFAPVHEAHDVGDGEPKLLGLRGRGFCRGFFFTSVHQIFRGAVFYVVLGSQYDKTFFAVHNVWLHQLQRQYLKHLMILRLDF